MPWAPRSDHSPHALRAHLAQRTLHSRACAPRRARHRRARPQHVRHSARAWNPRSGVDALRRAWRRDRVMGNPRFLRVLGVEVVLGCTAKTMAEVQTRGSRMLEELDFLASDLSLEARASCHVSRRLWPRRARLRSAVPSLSCQRQQWVKSRGRHPPLRSRPQTPHKPNPKPALKAALTYVVTHSTRLCRARRRSSATLRSCGCCRRGATSGRRPCARWPRRWPPSRRTACRCGRGPRSGGAPAHGSRYVPSVGSSPFC